MSKIKFIPTKKDGFYEYHLPSSLSDFFDQSILYTDVELDEEAYYKWQKQLTKKGISYVATQENLLLYSMALDYFRSKKTKLFSDANTYKIDQIPDDGYKIKWRYAIEYTSDDEHLCRTFGLLSDREFLRAVNYYNQNTTDFYAFTALKEMVTKQFIEAYNCDVSTWSFLYTYAPAELAEVLSNQNKRPSLEDIFNYSELMINLQIGEDEGYLDYMQIISPVDISEKVKHLEIGLNRYVKGYEKLVQSLGTTIDNIEKTIEFNTRFDALEKNIRQLLSIAD